MYGYVLQGPHTPDHSYRSTPGDRGRGQGERGHLRPERDPSELMYTKSCCFPEITPSVSQIKYNVLSSTEYLPIPGRDNSHVFPLEKAPSIPCRL